MSIKQHSLLPLDSTPRMTMTETTRQSQLDALLLEPLPAAGKPLGKCALSARFASEAQQAGLDPQPDDFTAARERLLAAGLVVKGKGRGRATGRASAADDFALGEAASPLLDEEPAAPNAKAQRAKSAKAVAAPCRRVLAGCMGPHGQGVLLREYVFPMFPERNRCLVARANQSNPK